MRAADFDQQVAASQAQFNKQVADANLRFAAQKDWGARLQQQQMANPKVTGNPAMVTNALLAQKKGFANVGAWYQDIMDRLGNIDPKVYEPAQKELDQYEANIKKDKQHATPRQKQAWLNKTLQQVRKDYKAVGPYPFTEGDVPTLEAKCNHTMEGTECPVHGMNECDYSEKPQDDFMSRLKTLSGILVR